MAMAGPYAAVPQLLSETTTFSRILRQNSLLPITEPNETPAGSNVSGMPAASAAWRGREPVRKAC